MPRDKSSLMGRTMNETQFDSKTETRPMGISGRLSGGPAAHCRHSSGSKSKRCTLGLFPPLLLDLPPRGYSARVPQARATWHKPSAKLRSSSATACCIAKLTSGSMNWPRPLCMHAASSVLLTGGWASSFGSPNAFNFRPDR
jgi:hypothetical protein